MSVRIIGVNPGSNLEGVYDSAGGTVVTDAIELNVNLATTVVNADGSTRQVSRKEVIDALNLIEQYIIRMPWPPAAS